MVEPPLVRHVTVHVRKNILHPHNDFVSPVSLFTGLWLQIIDVERRRTSVANIELRTGAIYWVGSGKEFEIALVQVIQGIRLESAEARIGDDIKAKRPCAEEPLLAIWDRQNKVAP